MAENLNPVDEFFAKSLVGVSGVRDDRRLRTQRVLEHILARSDRVADLFADAGRFREYVARQGDPASVHSRMRAEVRRHAGGSPSESAVGEAASDEAVSDAYRALVERGAVDPAAVFDDVPETPPLCSFKGVSDAAKLDIIGMTRAQSEQFNEAWSRAIKIFATRWQALTGQPFDVSTPWVEHLVRRKAPVPHRPSWRASLASREARAMNAEPEAVRAAHARRRRASAVEAAASADAASEGDDNGDRAAGCDADALLARAHVAPLLPPGANEPRYTFPGTLLQREDIFYDYGLIVPVDECGPLSPQVTGVDRRALTAVRAIASAALAVLNYLDGLNLSAALGQLPDGTAIADTLRQDLGRLIANVDEATPTQDVQGWKTRMAEWATFVRDAARRSLFLARLTSSDPRTVLNDLSAAIANMPAMQLYQEDEIAYDEAPEGRDLANYLEIDGLRIGNVRAVYGNMALDANDQVRNLKRYLAYLAGQVRMRIEQLVSAASDMRDAVARFQGNAQQVQEDFDRLAAGTINDAATVLARLLDDIASELPLWREEWAEGSMRLGLLVIFRQYWSPEGYVKGKLVGYKNLIPDQKEKIRRRTFIKTVSEQLTTQEFASTRQQDFSRTQKETAEVIKEAANKFNMSVTASGGFDILIGSLNVTTNTGFEFSNMSRSTQSSLAEATMKTSMTYNEKREVKLREETERQDEFESVTELANPNQEITANYFYYQLLRQYLVSVEFHDVRPVLLRTRSVPSESAIGDKFLADHAHLLINALPAQLAADLQDTVNDIDGLARTVLTARVRYFDDQRAYQDILRSARPADPDQARDRDDRLARLQDAARESFTAFTSAEESYLKARVRLDRVLEHVRRNRCHYIQFIWQASPTTDYDRILRTETFGGIPLPELTRGLQRQGYFGNEEIFDFVGPSWGLADALMRLLTPGSDLAALPEDALRDTELFQLLARYYSDEELDALIDQIANQTFATDPARRSTVLTNRRVQIAQDALVVETLPGQIPLLEGFKAAHRMLDMERACLENEHLLARIEDRPWKERGDDSYRVYRREGEAAPARETEP